MKGLKTVWTKKMIEKITKDYPVRFTMEIAKELHLSYRTIIRAARQFGINKDPGFLEINKDKIQALAKAALPENPNKGNKNFRIANYEAHQFRPGQKQLNINYSLIHEKRNATIRKERLRLKYGLPPQTKLRLKD